MSDREDSTTNHYDMHDNVVLVTGANSGVGFLTAKQLAEAGAAIVMVVRDWQSRAVVAVFAAALTRSRSDPSSVPG